MKFLSPMKYFVVIILMVAVHMAKPEVAEGLSFIAILSVMFYKGFISLIKMLMEM